MIVQMLTKQQILRQHPEKIKSTIYKLNDLEVKTKINFENSVKLITDFILSQISLEPSN